MNSKSKNTQKIKVAISGCGKISKNHFDAILSLNSDFKLVAGCDVNKEIIDGIEKKYKIKTYSQFEDMISSENLDLVAICTPSGLHPLQTKLASKNKINVITEKPMAINLSDGIEMVESCKNYSTKLFVVKQLRLNPTMQFLKRAISENRFGKIYLAQTNVFWTRPQSYYDENGGWRGTRDMDGGALMNQASHYVDLMYWMLGPVSKLTAFAKTHRNIEMEDTAVLNMELASGAIAGLSVTMLTYPKNLESSITILGEKGSVRIGGVSANEVQSWQFDEKKDYDDIVKNPDKNIHGISSTGHESYYKNVANVLNGTEAPISDGNEGLKSLQILDAAYKSIKNKSIQDIIIKDYD